METLNPCKIETLEQIDTQFVRIDYVHESSKFGKNRFTGDFWAKGWNITFSVTFYLFLFFSRTNVEKRPLDWFWRAMAQKTPNRAGMCLFGVIKWKIELWPLSTPKTPKICPWIGNFQSKWWNMKLQVYQKVLNQSRWKFNTMLGT